MRTSILIPVVLAAGVAITAAGCAAPALAPSTPDTAAHPDVTPAPTTATPPAPPPAADLAGVTADEVCARFTAALYSADAVTDHRAEAAAIRATSYATAGLAAELAATAHEPRWPALTFHRARLHTSVTRHVEAEQPPDSSTTAYRAARATTIAVGADGWRTDPDTRVVYCVLRQEAGAWRVGGFDVVEVP